MIPHIPDQRRSATTKPFNDLVAYVQENKEHEQQIVSQESADILNYITASSDQITFDDKCLAIRTHRIADITTAALEMNEVSAKNTRCKDPAYHFILSWPEHETPEPDAIFDAAEHAIKALGLADHQYVLAVHGNTDNRHCHVAVNRVNPVTFESHNIEWSKKTLHYAARESEIKHGWTHDNGIYIVNTNGHGKKTIGLNPDFDDSIPYAHRRSAREAQAALPAWHDPDSLESWLKTDVSRALKRTLPKLDSWNALHTWLANYDIQLVDTGGGGMRIKATSPDTGEQLDLPVSRGLRQLKRADLEKRFGKFMRMGQVDFTDGAAVADIAPKPKIEPETPTPSITPDVSHLTPQQLIKGANHVLSTRSILDDDTTARRLDNILLHTEFDRGTKTTQRGRGLHELSDGGMDVNGQGGNVLLPYAARLHLGDSEAGQDQDLRRPGTRPPGGRSQRSLNRDDSKRDERREHRAVMRADLRSRFSQYQRFVRENDTGLRLDNKQLGIERRAALKAVRDDEKAAKKALRASAYLEDFERMRAGIAINANTIRRNLEIAADFEAKSQALKAIRQPPLGWREWLQEQANLGDQAALSALRGMVYQAQRDAKKAQNQELNADDGKTRQQEEEKVAETEAEREYQFKQLMARLLEEERREIAIRSAKLNAMRPFEADALLARYQGIQWRVSGNGNIRFSDRFDNHLFTDRGNRVTFDKAHVSDEEIRLALVHAQQKFGKALTLTGDDPIFTARMARLADDMSIPILNPELRKVILKHRESKELQITEAPAPEIPLTVAPAETPKTPTSPRQPVVVPAIPVTPKQPAKEPVLPPVSETPAVQEMPVEPITEPVIEIVEAVKTTEQRLREKVLSIDPHAEFVVADPAVEKSFTGSIAAVSEVADEPLFAQHTGRGVYVIHPIHPPGDVGNNLVNVKYVNGKAVVNVVISKGKGRGE